MRQPPSPPVTVLALLPGRRSTQNALRYPLQIKSRMPRRSRAPFVAGFFTMFLALLACCAATSISGSFSLASWLALTPDQISEWASSCLTTTPSAAVCNHQVLASSNSPVFAAGKLWW